MKRTLKYITAVITVVLAFACGDDAKEPVTPPPGGGEEETVYLDISPSGLTFDHLGGTDDFTIKTDAKDWEAVSGESWIILRRVDKPAGLIRVAVGEWDGEKERSGIITVSTEGLEDQTVSVTQGPYEGSVTEKAPSEYLPGKWIVSAYAYNNDVDVEFELDIKFGREQNSLEVYMGYNVPPASDQIEGFPLVIMVDPEEPYTLLLPGEYLLGAVAAGSVYQRLSHLEDGAITWVYSYDMEGSYDGDNQIIFHHEARLGDETHRLYISQAAVKDNSYRGRVSADFYTDLVLQKAE